jgi:hypothetical protein
MGADLLALALVTHAPASSEESDPVVRAYLEGVDRTLVRKNLSLGVEERFLQLMALQRLAEELREAGRRTTAR